MGIGGIISGAAGGEAGTAATIAKYSGAAAVGKQVLGAGKNMAWLLVIFGIVQYIIRIMSGSNYGFSFVLSLGLFVFSGYALSQRLGKDSRKTKLITNLSRFKD